MLVLVAVLLFPSTKLRLFFKPIRLMDNRIIRLFGQVLLLETADRLRWCSLTVDGFIGSSSLTGHGSGLQFKGLFLHGSFSFSLR